MQKIFCSNKFNEDNDKMYLKIKKEGTLLDLRNALEKRRNFNLLFFLKSNGNYYSKEEEKIFILKTSEIMKIYFTNINKIKIYLDKTFLCDINFENISLEELRIKLGEKITSQHKFFFNHAFILDEENFKVFEICSYGVVEINKISDEILYSLKKKDILIEEELNDSMEINNNKFEKNIFIKNNNKLLNINKKNVSEPFRLLPMEDYNKKEMGIKGDSNIIMFEKKISNNKKRNNSINPKKRKKKTIKYNIFFNDEIDPDFPFFECSPNVSL